ncbi:MAG: transposase [Oscillospiraceae bacterium]|nr:transposase [Oscillospiraceae bacterium]
MRLQGYDYSCNGAYFVTICTQNREMLFGDVGADSISARMIATIFEWVISQYNDVYCPNYVVMPNHFHAIIIIEKDYTQNVEIPKRADIESAPTLSEIIQTFKRYSTLEYIKMVNQGILPPFNKRIWQRSYHDHIIRNERDFQMIYEYITNNPINWENDCFYNCEI